MKIILRFMGHKLYDLQKDQQNLTDFMVSQISKNESDNFTDGQSSL